MNNPNDPDITLPFSTLFKLIMRNDQRITLSIDRFELFRSNVELEAIALLLMAKDPEEKTLHMNVLPPIVEGMVRYKNGTSTVDDTLYIMWKKDEWKISSAGEATKKAASDKRIAYYDAEQLLLKTLTERILQKFGTTMSEPLAKSFAINIYTNKLTEAAKQFGIETLEIVV
jgi:hypothetical protein